MTDREAEAFAARLTRVWEPTSSFTFEPWRGAGLDVGKAWRFGAPLSARFDLQVSASGLQGDLFIRLDERATHGHGQKCRANTIIWVDREKIYLSHDDVKIATQWLPIFRRGCWLSGSGIEASAHEKAEWIQSFDREEVEAWNLKI